MTIIRLVQGLALFLIATLFDTTAALSAGKRLALVVGNSNYQSTPYLANPGNDAKLIAEALEGNGFEVARLLDADLKKMKRSVQALTNQARKSGQDTLVLFYYAGHGIQVRQNNYLIPVDAKIESESDVDIEGLSVDSILSTIAEGGGSTNIVILDACRDNPFLSGARSTNSGLARVSSPRVDGAQFLIALSTDPGKIARDGPPGGNSPYSATLARMLQKPGLKIEDVFKSVRQDVYAVTNGAQNPWEISNIVADIYLSKSAGASSTPRVKSDGEAIDLQKKKHELELLAAKAEAEAEKRKAESAVAKADLARRKAETDAERTKAETAQARAELEKARADAELARLRAETDAAQARVAAAKIPAPQPSVESRSLNQDQGFDSTSLFTTAAIPSFDCEEYSKRSFDDPERNPQTDIFCIVPEAARIDNYMGVVFRQRLSGSSQAGRRDAIRDQKQWIIARNQRCSGRWDDLASATGQRRIASCLIAETNARIKALQQ